MCAGATSMPAVSVGRITSVSDDAAIGEDIGHRTFDGVEVDPEAGGQVRLRIHVDAEDAEPLLGERAGEIDRRRGLADAALLVGDRDHIRHRGITSRISGGGAAAVGRGKRCSAMRTPADRAALFGHRGYPQVWELFTEFCGYRRRRSRSQRRQVGRIAGMMMRPRVLAQRHARDEELSARCRRTRSGSRRLERCARHRCVGGGAARVDRSQHAPGKLTARERLDLLLDPGSFVELDAFVTNRDASSATRSHSSATASSRATARSTAGWCSSSARTSRSSADRCRRRTPRRSARSWIWR